MAKIVGGFTVPHAPLIYLTPDAAPPEQSQACWDGYATIVQRVRELDVDTVIVIGDDHYTLFGPACIPSILIGIGEVEGPFEPWFNTPRTRIENNQPLAQHILRYGHQHGVDWAVSKSLVVDHSIFVPFHHAIRPVSGLKTIPVYLNAGVDPLIQNRRCHQVGQSIAAAVESWPGNERVAIYATGGVSHWPGMAQWEELNPEWDLQMIKLLEAGDAEALIAMSDDEMLKHGGNGAWEIKNWICMMGALGDCRGKLITYQPVYKWLGSCAYVEMKTAA